MFGKIKYFVAVLCGIILIGCGSVPYELDESKIKKEEKTVITDTLKTVTENREENKEIKEIKEEKVSEKIESFTFIVQIGAFAVPGNFERFFANAKSVMGSEVYYEMIGSLYKIRIGKFSNKAEALQLLDNVKSKGYYDAFIITVRNK